MTQTNPIQSVIAAARRRAIVQLMLEQASWGVAAGLVAFALLLLVGSEIFRWYWPLLLLAVTAGVGWWRSRGRVPAPYGVAQSVDARLRLSDLVSTAYFYSNQSPARTPDAQFLSVLNERAGAAAAAADPREAFPMYWPRSAWAAAAALSLAVVLFTVRYGVLRTFDLRAPLATVSFDTLTGAPKPSPKAPSQMAQKLPDPFGLTVQDPEGTGVDEKDSAVQESLKSVDVNDPNQVGRPGTGDQSQAGDQQDESGDDSEDGEAASKGSKKSPPGEGAGREAGDQAPKQQGPPQKENSLMDKMRDALANMMDKLKMEPPGGESKQASSKGNQKGQQKGEKGQPQQGKSNQQGDPNDTQPGDQQSQSDASQQAKSNQAGNQEPPSNQEKSGIGRQDGKKDTELAEQRDAMGKLSELLGKRALNVQAEVMVEVTNSKNQQLKTPYVNRTGRHMEAGSDLNRDEVPLHQQEYVQRYYEQVRKQAPAVPKQ